MKISAESAPFFRVQIYKKLGIRNEELGIIFLSLRDAKSQRLRVIYSVSLCLCVSASLCLISQVFLE